MIFTTMEIDFYHHANFSLPTEIEIFSITSIVLFLNGNTPITLTFYREMEINKEAQCNGIKNYEIL